MDTKQVFTLMTQIEFTICDDNLTVTERALLANLLARTNVKGGRIIKQWQSMSGPQTKKAAPVQRNLEVGTVEVEVM